MIVFCTDISLHSCSVDWQRMSQSTICYAMAIAALHFHLIVEPNEYHSKKKDICENGLDLWNIAG